MRKAISIALSAAAACLAFAACQKTPDAPIVVQKDMEQMMEKAGENEGGATVAEQAQAAQGAAFTMEQGHFSIEADAEVRLPEAESIIIMKVGRSGFTQEMSDRLIAALVHGQLVEATWNGPNCKAAIERSILNEREAIAIWEAAAAETEDENRKANYHSLIASANRVINDDLMPLLEAAPDEPRPISTKLTGSEYGSGLMGAAESEYGFESVEVRNDRDNCAGLFSYVREDDGFRPHGEGIGIFSTLEFLRLLDASSGLTDYNFAPMSIELFESMDADITPQQALSAAGELIEALGLEQTALGEPEKVYNQGGSNNAPRCLYRVPCYRAIDGIYETWTEHNGAIFTDNDDSTVPWWAYERIEIYVDKKGIAAFYWLSPYEMLDTMVENAAIMSFEEITDIAQRMLPVMYSRYISEDWGADTTMSIDRIELGLARVSARDDYNSGLLIPCWDFYGSLVMHYTNDDGEPMKEDIAIPDQSFITINAIDGSIIDRYLGY